MSVHEDQEGAKPGFVYSLIVITNVGDDIHAWVDGAAVSESALAQR